MSLQSKPCLSCAPVPWTLTCCCSPCDIATSELWEHNLDGARLALEVTMAAEMRVRDF